MPLTQPQIDFLGDKLKIKVDASERLEVDAGRKEELIAQALASLPDEETLRAVFDISLKDRAGKKDVAMIADDPTRAVESEEASETQGLTLDQANLINEVMTRHLIPAIDRLRRAKDGAGGNVFDDKDIAIEIFEPLKRRGLFPENLIPDKHSQV